MIDTIKQLDWVSVIGAVLVIASAVAAVTPTEKDDGVVSRIRNLWAKYTGQA